MNDILKNLPNGHLLLHSVDCEDRQKCCLSALELQATVMVWLSAQSKQSRRDAVRVVEGLWLEGIDHPYDTASYNSALEKATQILKGLL